MSFLIYSKTRTVPIYLLTLYHIDRNIKHNVHKSFSNCKLMLLIDNILEQFIFKGYFRLLNILLLHYNVVCIFLKHWINILNYYFLNLNHPAGYNNIPETYFVFCKCF